MQLGWVGGGTGNCIPGSLRERRAERELLLESVVSASIGAVTIYSSTASYLPYLDHEDVPPSSEPLFKCISPPAPRIELGVLD